MNDHHDTNHALASTARWTASVRAEESTRSDSLFKDPWAVDLARITDAGCSHPSRSRSPACPTNGT